MHICRGWEVHAKTHMERKTAAAHIHTKGEISHNTRVHARRGTAAHTHTQMEREEQHTRAHMERERE